MERATLAHSQPTQTRGLPGESNANAIPEIDFALQSRGNRRPVKKSRLRGGKNGRRAMTA
jgi:hypothetical protein